MVMMNGEYHDTERGMEWDVGGVDCRDVVDCGGEDCCCSLGF